ncbi:hypothetical protein C8R43DRAFT_1203187, partial [Mycena crocata]
PRKPHKRTFQPLPFFILQRTHQPSTTTTSARPSLPQYALPFLARRPRPQRLCSRQPFAPGQCRQRSRRSRHRAAQHLRRSADDLQRLPDGQGCGHVSHACIGPCRISRHPRNCRARSPSRRCRSPGRPAHDRAEQRDFAALHAFPRRRGRCERGHRQARARHPRWPFPRAQQPRRKTWAHWPSHSPRQRPDRAPHHSQQHPSGPSCDCWWNFDSGYRRSCWSSPGRPQSV